MLSNFNHTLITYLSTIVEIKICFQINKGSCRAIKSTIVEIKICFQISLFVSLLFSSTIVEIKICFQIDLIFFNTLDLQ